MNLSHPIKQFIAIFGMVAVTAFWGSTFILVKWTIKEMDLYFFLFLRFLLASLILCIIFHKKVFSAKPHTIKSGFILALFMSAAYIFQTEGLKTTTASNSALITGLYLVLIPLFTAIFMRLRVKVLSAIGAAIAFAGLYLLTQYSFSGFNFGDALTLVCALACSCHVIFTGKYTHEHEVVPLVAYQLIFTTLICGIVVVIKSSYTLHIPNIAILTIVVTAIFATIIAFVVQTAAQRVIDPTRTGIIMALESVFGVIFACWWGSEQLTTLSMIGAACMVAGMVVSEIHPIAERVMKRMRKSGEL